MINNCSIVNGTRYFSENGLQNYIVFQPFSRYFTYRDGKIGSLLLKGMSEENITAQPTTSCDDEIIYSCGKEKRKFKGICLI